MIKVMSGIKGKEARSPWTALLGCVIDNVLSKEMETAAKTPWVR